LIVLCVFTSLVAHTKNGPKCSELMIKLNCCRIMLIKEGSDKSARLILKVLGPSLTGAAPLRDVVAASAVFEQSLSPISSRVNKSSQPVFKSGTSESR